MYLAVKPNAIERALAVAQCPSSAQRQPARRTWAADQRGPLRVGQQWSKYTSLYGTGLVLFCWLYLFVRLAVYFVNGPILRL